MRRGSIFGGGGKSFVRSDKLRGRGGAKVHQAPSPKSNAPHATPKPCAKPLRAPREVKGGTSVLGQQLQEPSLRANKR